MSPMRAVLAAISSFHNCSKLTLTRHAAAMKIRRRPRTSVTSPKIRSRIRDPNAIAVMPADMAMRSYTGSQNRSSTRYSDWTSFREEGCHTLARYSCRCRRTSDPGLLVEREPVLVLGSGPRLARPGAEVVVDRALVVPLRPEPPLRGVPGLVAGDAVFGPRAVAVAVEEALERRDGARAGDVVDRAGVAVVHLQHRLDAVPAQALRDGADGRRLRVVGGLGDASEHVVDGVLRPVPHEAELLQLGSVTRVVVHVGSGSLDVLAALRRIRGRVQVGRAVVRAAHVPAVDEPLLLGLRDARAVDADGTVLVLQRVHGVGCVVTHPHAGVVLEILHGVLPC